MSTADKSILDLQNEIAAALNAAIEMGDDLPIPLRPLLQLSPGVSVEYWDPQSGVVEIRFVEPKTPPATAPSQPATANPRGRAEEFQPIAIRGESLSQTIARDRR